MEAYGCVVGSYIYRQQTFLQCMCNIRHAAAAMSGQQGKGRKGNHILCVLIMEIQLNVILRSSNVSGLGQSVSTTAGRSLCFTLIATDNSN